MIKTHIELAEFIAGKSILHLNSYGKESILCLEWLTRFAHPSRVVSVHCQALCPHPDDEPYLNYLKKRYPEVEFKIETNSFDITRVLTGSYQSPIDVINDWNGSEYDSFDWQQMMDDLRKENGCDYTADGRSRYESFSRANYFHRNGLVNGTQTCPLGMMSKKQIMHLLEASGVKLHPVYKVSKSTLDRASYFKMRASFLVNPDYEKRMLQTYPLLALDKFRWEELFTEKIRRRKL